MQNGSTFLGGGGGGYPTDNCSNSPFFLFKCSGGKWKSLFFIGGGNKNKNLGRTRLQHHRYKSILVINLGQVFRTTLAQLKKLNKNVFMHSTSKKTVTMSLITKNLNLATIFCIFTLFPLRTKQVGRWQI